MRALTDLEAMGDLQITLDCDVLHADRGTGTAGIFGAYVALHDACSRLLKARRLQTHLLREVCAAASVGIVDALSMLDLADSEDSRAEVDMNVGTTSSGRFVEVPGDRGGMPFSRSELDNLLGVAEHGIASLVDVQAEVLATRPPGRA